MNPISWIAEKVVTIVAQMIGTAVVTQVETEALKHHVNAIGELEAEATKHEEAGNPLLAQLLRDNSQRLAGRTDFTSLEFTPAQKSNSNSKSNQSPEASAVKNISHGQPGKKKRGRPRKNQNSNQTAPAEAPQQNEAQQ
jgi:hypothetical protein